ncbi:MAG: 50S ribosomal protein L11 methyltransferase [Ginsengibacter sp.]
MKKYFKIKIETASVEEGELLVATLSDIQYYAFEQEGTALNAYIREEDFSEELLKDILPGNAIFIKEIIEEQNWNHQWEQSIKPIIVNNFAGIHPIFQQPIKNVKHDIIITPKMSFGTGHHATTFLMVEMMEMIDFAGKEVLDFGTGTGLLAILAEKCGAAKILAIDNDEWSINNAIENTAANNCKNIFIELSDVLSDVQPMDVILANINLNVLNKFSLDLSKILKPGSFLLASGFLLKDVKEMQNIFEEKNVVIKYLKQRGEWMVILFQKVL